jgi:hypothetical protein
MDSYVFGSHPDQSYSFQTALTAQTVTPIEITSTVPAESWKDVSDVESLPSKEKRRYSGVPRAFAWTRSGLSGEASARC